MHDEARHRSRSPATRVCAVREHAVPGAIDHRRHQARPLVPLVRHLLVCERPTPIDRESRGSGVVERPLPSESRGPPRPSTSMSRVRVEHRRSRARTSAPVATVRTASDSRSAAVPRARVVAACRARASTTDCARSAPDAADLVIAPMPFRPAGPERRRTVRRHASRPRHGVPSLGGRRTSARRPREVEHDPEADQQRPRSPRSSTSRIGADQASRIVTTAAGHECGGRSTSRATVPRRSWRRGLDPERQAEDAVEA